MDDCTECFSASSQTPTWPLKDRDGNTHSAKQGQISARMQKVPTLSVSLSPLSAKHSAGRGAVRGGCTDLLFSVSLCGFLVFPGSRLWDLQRPSLKKRKALKKQVKRENIQKFKTENTLSQILGKHVMTGKGREWLFSTKSSLS